MSRLKAEKNPFLSCFALVLAGNWMTKMNDRDLSAKNRGNERFAGLSVNAVTTDIEERKTIGSTDSRGFSLAPDDIQPVGSAKGPLAEGYEPV